MTECVAQRSIAAIAQAKQARRAVENAYKCSEMDFAEQQVKLKKTAAYQFVLMLLKLTAELVVRTRT